jgi:uncharacterized protein (TIGR03067 family)
MKLLRLIPVILVIPVISMAFFFQSTELQGKWKLWVANSKLIGYIEIKDGKYNYTVSPNYKETGNLKLNDRTQPTEINLIVSRSKGKADTTRGIYKIVNKQLSLCLGKMNGPRPKKFENNSSANFIFWTGSK